MQGNNVTINHLTIQKYFFQLAVFLFLIIFLFGYPGQNYYQTLAIAWKKPEVIPLPKALNFNPAPYPKSKLLLPYPALSAKSAILIDVPSAVVLYQKNPNIRLSPASTTKIMTALVALDSYKLDQVFIIGSQYEKEGAQMGLLPGDLVTFQSLLFGMLINSGNDAASILANHYPGGEKAFIERMNKKARDLSLYNTHFINADGFNDANHYTSALDLARLATLALQNPLFSKIVSTKITDVPDASYKKFYHLENVNKLLGMMPGINGIKTGWTEEAGECLVGSAERNNRKLVSVILGSTDRFGDTKRFIEWGFANFQWEEPQAIDY